MELLLIVNNIFTEMFKLRQNFKKKLILIVKHYNDTKISYLRLQVRN